MNDLKDRIKRIHVKKAINNLSELIQTFMKIINIQIPKNKD